MGNGDMLERARLIAMRFGWSRDEDLAGALDIVTKGGARALGTAGYGLEPGCAASFVLVSAETIGEAVVSHPVPRTVIAHGKLLVPPSSFGTAGSSGRALS
jgi:cytosine deaminase